MRTWDHRARFASRSGLSLGRTSSIHWSWGNGSVYDDRCERQNAEAPRVPQVRNTSNKGIFANPHFSVS